MDWSLIPGKLHKRLVCIIMGRLFHSRHDQRNFIVIGRPSFRPEVTLMQLKLPHQAASRSILLKRKLVECLPERGRHPFQELAVDMGRATLASYSYNQFFESKGWTYLVDEICGYIDCATYLNDLISIKMSLKEKSVGTNRHSHI